MNSVPHGRTVRRLQRTCRNIGCLVLLSLGVVAGKADIMPHAARFEVAEGVSLR